MCMCFLLKYCFFKKVSLLTEPQSSEHPFPSIASREFEARSGGMWLEKGGKRNSSALLQKLWSVCSSMVPLALVQVPLKSPRSLLNLWFPHSLPAALRLPSGKSHLENFCHGLPHPHGELLRPLAEVKARFRDWLFTPVQEREEWWEAWEGQTFPSAPTERRVFLGKLNRIHFLFPGNRGEA